MNWRFLTPKGNYDDATVTYTATNANVDTSGLVTLDSDLAVGEKVLVTALVVGEDGTENTIPCIDYTYEFVSQAGSLITTDKTDEMYINSEYVWVDKETNTLVILATEEEGDSFSFSALSGAAHKGATWSEELQDYENWHYINIPYLSYSSGEITVMLDEGAAGRHSFSCVNKEDPNIMYIAEFTIKIFGK